MQHALKKQLSAEEARLDEELKQKKKILNSIEKERENTGAEVYDLQQKLVKLQKEIENNQIIKRNAEVDKVNQQRLLQKIEESMEMVKKENYENDINYQRRLEELSRQNLDFQKINNFLKELKNQGDIKKREVFKSEETLNVQERRKDRQDYLISSLTDEKKRLFMLKNEFLEKLNLKYREKEELTTLLAETATEVEKVTLTKRNVLINLRKSLIDLGEKTKSLDAVNDLLRVEKEKFLIAKSALNGTKNQKKCVYNTYSHYETLLHKLQTGLKLLAQERDMLTAKRERALSKLHIINSSLSSTENEVLIFTNKQEALRNSLSTTVKAIMKLHTEVQKTCEDILRKANDHKTENKLQRTIKTKFINTESKIQVMEQDVEVLENELARLRLDILNTEVLLGGLANNRVATQKEKEEREKAVSMLECEIKENHEIHDKKMLEVAKYNNEYHKIRQKLSTNLRAPTETLLFSYREQLLKLNRERKDIEGEFIRLQSANIEKEISLSKIVDELNGLKKKAEVLSQRQKRLISEQSAEDKEIKGALLSIKICEYDLTQLNDFCTKFSQKNTHLNEKTINYISEFKEKLKILESEATKYEIELDRLKEKKSSILQEIMGVEQQGLLWERKIELEKEMQSTLNPDVGQTEIVKLQKENHLLSLELARIKKEQEGFTVSVEKAIHRKDFISSKYLHKENLKQSSNQAFNQKATPISILSGGINSAARGSLIHSIEALKGAISTSRKTLESLSQKILITNSQINSLNITRNTILTELESLRSSMACEKNRLYFAKLTKISLNLRIFGSQQSAFALEKIIKKGKSPKAMPHAINIGNKVGQELEKTYIVILECINKNENMTTTKQLVQEIYQMFSNFS